MTENPVVWNLERAVEHLRAAYSISKDEKDITKQNPEKFGTNLSETAPAALFAVRLTPKQARIIAVALNGAAALQEAQKE